MSRSPRKDDQDVELQRLEREMIEEVLNHVSSTRRVRTETSGEATVSNDNQTTNNEGENR